jgi:hypothetical protein
MYIAHNHNETQIEINSFSQQALQENIIKCNKIKIWNRAHVNTVHQTGPCCFFEWHNEATTKLPARCMK